MNIVNNLLVGSASVAILVGAAAPVAAQTPYGYGQYGTTNSGGVVGAIINSVLGGGRYGTYGQGNDRQSVDLCARAAEARVSADNYLEGAPELVVEVAASSASFDLNEKLRVYQRNGVREYIVWRVERQQVDWFVLRDGRFDRLAPTSTGLLCSETFPGLWLDADALTRGDFVEVMAALQRGIQDPTHAAFVAELRSRVVLL